MVIINNQYINTVSTTEVNLSGILLLGAERRTKKMSPLVVEKNDYPMSTFKQEMGVAPPPPYFVNPPSQWSTRMSESTSSTHGSQSKLDGLSLQSSVRNQPLDRPDILPPFSGKSLQL